MKKEMNQVHHPELVVIDTLEVGPVQMEPDRLVMPYKVRTGGEDQENQLTYKFEEPVFRPSDPNDQNLAAMMGIQVALNYGLFCKEIRFIGLFDPTDQRFIREMMENTAREILVNKIFQPTPFLKEGYRALEVVASQTYTQAKITFADSREKDPDLHWEHWAVEKERFLVLSSGGKDSLLSYGLLKEMGREAHPVFGNESGRHWFTALNGYRYLRAQEPNTSRVWMNSDRLFAWMLQFLPFIRKDFSRVRADDYPIRLWTVAVFLFGVLPLMKKRGIGRLVIGDEYDSSQRGNFKGISHYNGLFDQSRWFDDQMSRYFLKKGWGISQFSILRPMSELLIMKTLVKRYPDLQAQQVSCHAAHESNGRIYPCGKCEKCRRIVGMMVALGEDPGRCGYTPAQAQAALESLRDHSVKQIGPDAAQLFHLLHNKGLLPQHRKAHPEVMHLRFDRERSHIHGIPNDIRKDLYSLLLETADGALYRQKGVWQQINLLAHSDMELVYPFEVNRSRGAGGKGERPFAGARTSKFLWGEMSWEELGELLKTVDTALLPVGAIEQHGPHLPTDVDAFDADYLARKVAEACSDPKPLVLPLVPYGVSYHHNDFPGTVSISNESMSRFIYDIGMSVARQGIRKLVIINGHGDNAPTLNFAAQMINRDTGIFVCVDTGETSDADISPLTKTLNDIHAGEVETSTTLALRPHLVRMDKAKKQVLRFGSRYLDFYTKNAIPWYVHTSLISKDGTMGDPTIATAEKGRRYWEIMIAHLVAFVEELKHLKLEEIYQKRY